MKATKFLLLLWALALGSTLGWAQSVTQPTLTMTPGPNVSSNVAVCPSGGTVALSYTSSGGTVQLELRANTITGPLVNTFGTAGIISPAPAGVVTNTSVVLPALTAGNTYHLIVNVTSGMLSETKSVTIIPAAIPAGAADFTLNPTTVCLTPGNSATATVNSPNTASFAYTFTTNMGTAGLTLGNTTATSTEATPAAVGTGNVTLTVGYRSMTCGTATSTQALTVVAASLPTDIVLVSPPGPQPFCRGTELTLSSSCPAGQTPTWFKGDAPEVIGIGSPITVAPNPISPTDVHVYKVKCRVNGSLTCESEPKSITINTVDQASLVPSVTQTSPLEVCQTTTGGTTTLSASVTCPAGSTPLWYDDNVSMTPAQTGGSTRSVTVSTETPATFRRYVTCKAGSCESATRAEYKVEVKAKPGKPVVTTASLIICANNDPFVAGLENVVTINATPSVGTGSATCATINWFSSASDMGPFTTFVGTGGSFQVVGSTAGTTYYKAVCVGPAALNCPSDLSDGTITVTVNPIPVAPSAVTMAAATAGRICFSASSQSIDLTATCTGTTAVWTPTNGGPAIADNATTATVTPGLAGSIAGTEYMYEVRCKDANGCVSAKTSTSFFVHTTPVTPTVVATQPVICMDNQGTITANCAAGQIVAWSASVDGGMNYLPLPGTTNTLATDAATLLGVFGAGGFNQQLTNDYKVRATCTQTPSSAGCNTSAFSAVVTTKLRYKEVVPVWQILSTTNDVIASDAVTGADLCAGTSVKLVQDVTLGVTCQGGVINWYKQTSTDGVNFAPATSGFTTNDPASGWVAVNSNAIDANPAGTSTAPSTYVRYYSRCESICFSDLSAPKQIVINATPTPAAPVATGGTTCSTPGDAVNITVNLSGCPAQTGTTPTFTLTPKLISTFLPTGVSSTSTLGAISVAVTNVNGDGTAVYVHSVVAPALDTKNEYSYTVTCTRTYDVNPGGTTSTCTGTASAASNSITIISKPAAPTNLVVNTPSVCPGTGATLTATCASGATLVWSLATTPTVTWFTAGVSTGAPISSTTPPLDATTSYVARCERDGCSSVASTQVTVQIIVPVRPTLSATAAVICPAPSVGSSVKTTSVTVSGCSAPGEVIRWAREGAPASENLGSGTTLTVKTTGSSDVASTTFVIADNAAGSEVKFLAWCTRVNGAACEISSNPQEPFLVSVAANPDLQITAVPGLTVCQTNPLALNGISGSNLAIGGYAWVGSAALVTTFNQNLASVTTANAGPAVTGATPAMNGSYYFTANFNSCVFQSPSVTVNVVSTVAPPTMSAPTNTVCAVNQEGQPTTISVTATCPTGTTLEWVGTAGGANIPTPATNTTYKAVCKLGTCVSAEASVMVMTRPFEITIIDVNKSASNTNGASITSWNRIYPFASVGKVYAGTAGVFGNTNIYTSTAASRTELKDFGTPRFWTIDVKVCNPALTVGSIQYIMDRLDPTTGSVVQQFKTIENNAPYLQFGNATGYTTLYTVNDPAFGFYSPSGVYDAGFPKGKYDITIKAWSLPGVDFGPYPSNITKNTAGVEVASANYYIDITNANGAREGVESEEAEFATVAPNPVTRTLTLSINGVKGQEVKLNLVDASGRSLMTRSITPESNNHREEVDMSNSKTGMYFMQVGSPVKNATLKVLKVSQD